MKIFTGKVVNGRLELRDGEIPDGVAVTVVVSDEQDAEPVELSEAERALLTESLLQADQGKTIDARAFLRSLQR